MKPSLCLAVLFAFTATAWAQEPVRTLSDLPSRVQKGDRIRVKLRDGMVVSGRFDSVAGSSLRLSASRNSLRELSEITVAEVEKKRHDSVWNGAAIGALIGLGVGAAATAATCGTNDTECSTIATLVFLPTFTGGGLAIGALTDHFVYQYDPIYLQSASDRPRLRLSPLVSKNQKGVLVSWSF